MTRDAAPQVENPFRLDNRGIAGRFAVLPSKDGRLLVMLNCQFKGKPVVLRMAELEPDHARMCAETHQDYDEEGNSIRILAQDAEVPLATKFDRDRELRASTTTEKQQAISRNAVLLKSMSEWPFYWGPVNMQIVRADSLAGDRLQLDALFPKIPGGGFKLSDWSHNSPVNAYLPQQYGSVLAVTVQVADRPSTAFHVALTISRLQVAVIDEYYRRFDASLLILPSNHNQGSINGRKWQEAAVAASSKSQLAAEKFCKEQSYEKDGSAHFASGVNYLEACKYFDVGPWKGAGLRGLVQVFCDAGGIPVVKLSFWYIPPEKASKPTRLMNVAHRWTS